MLRCTPEPQSQGALRLPPNGLPCPPSWLPFQVLCPIADSFSEGVRALSLSVPLLSQTASEMIRAWQTGGQETRTRGSDNNDTRSLQHTRA